MDKSHEQEIMERNGWRYYVGGHHGKFQGKYDFLSWHVVYGTPQGDMVVFKLTRLAFGSKVVVDTWVEVDTPKA